MTFMPTHPDADILSADPGKWHAGVACFQRRVLVDAHFPKWPKDMRAESRQGDASAWIPWQVAFNPEYVVVEEPSTRRLKDQKGSQNDILFLSQSMGAFFARFQPTTCIKVPVTMWNDGRPKAATAAHVRARLSSQEKQIIDRLGLSKSDVEHVIDAVGVGLWAVARM